MKSIGAIGIAAQVIFMASGHGVRAADIHRTLFAGIETEHRSSFLNGGGKLSLELGSETRGFVLLTTGVSLSDARRADRGRLPKDGVNADARLFAGVERSFGAVYAGVAIGPSLVQFLDGRGAPRRRAGLALHADVWHRSTHDRLWIWTSLVDSSQPKVWMRLRHGWKITALPAYAGVEASASHEPRSDKLRLGLMLTEWRVGPLTSTIAGGWMRDRRRNGAYATLSSYWTF